MIIMKFNIKSVHKMSVQPPRTKICTSPYPTAFLTDVSTNNTHSGHNSQHFHLLS